METKKLQCTLCGHHIPQEHLRTHKQEEQRAMIEYTINFIKEQHPEWTENDPTCQKCWDYYKRL